MATAETLYANGDHREYRCKECKGGMTCRTMQARRTTLRCTNLECGKTLYVYRFAMGDSQVDLEVWPHECPPGMMLGTYVSSLMHQFSASAG